MGRTYDKAEDVPPHEYGLLLGTSPFTAQGARNFYFENRITSAAELYHAGKIKRIIVSGGDYSGIMDGRFNECGYDELRAMSDSLVAHGVPCDVIIRDYEGTRTLNSVVKAKDVYHLDSVVIISQKYHNERAIVQADKYGLKAIGYNAPHSHVLKNKVKNVLREFPARVKLFWDLNFGKSPEFLNEAIEVAPGRLEDWYYDPSCPDPRPNQWCFRSSADRGYGFIKVVSSDSTNLRGHLSYYNTRHGYHVLLPEGMGLNQRGENMMGGHDNEFYNNDTTLVVAAYGHYYDVVLVDIPEYADTIRRDEIEFLHTLSKNPKILTHEIDMIVSEGEIDHTNPDNPPADRFRRKMVMRKDRENREADMTVTIYYNDTLSYRMPEFDRIINTFPDMR